MSKTATITLAHGDGEAATLRFIRDEILTRFGNPSLDKLEDGSQIVLHNTDIVISTDTYIVDPPIFPGGDIGKLAVSGTVNDLLAAGALPRYFTLSLVISEGFPLPTLRRILDSAQHTAQLANIQIVAGDTKVLNKRANTEIYINTAGLGLPIKPGKDYAVSNAQVGDDVIVTGTVGDHGLAILSVREGLGFEQRVQSDCAPLHEMMIPLLRTFDRIHCLRDPTRGGLTGVLIDVAESSTVDVLLDQDQIPIKREVHFGCEMLGLNPLNMINEGKMVIVVAPEQTRGVMDRLCQHPLGRESKVVGVIQRASSPTGRLIVKKGYAKHVAVRPEGQALPRLC